METKEEKNNDDKFCGTVKDKWRLTEMMNKCCENMSKNDDCSSMMTACMSKCKWFPLMAMIFGIALFFLGYYLNAEITRVLWMIAAGFLILMGTFCLLMMSRMIRLSRRAK